MFEEDFQVRILIRRVKKKHLTGRSPAQFFLLWFPFPNTRPESWSECSSIQHQTPWTAGKKQNSLSLHTFAVLLFVTELAKKQKTFQTILEVRDFRYRTVIFFVYSGLRCSYVYVWSLVTCNFAYRQCTVWVYLAVRSELVLTTMALLMDLSRSGRP